MLLPRAFLVRQVLADRFDVAARLFGILRKKRSRLLVDFPVPFGEARAHSGDDFCDAKVAARGILDRRSRRSGERARVRGNRRSRRISARRASRSFAAPSSGSPSASCVALKTMQCVCKCGSSAREVSCSKSAADDVPRAAVRVSSGHANPSRGEVLPAPPPRPSPPPRARRRCAHPRRRAPLWRPTSAART